jgi:hypothetical protein
MVNDRQQVAQKKREILVHLNTLSNTVHDWTGKESQFTQLRTSLHNIETRFDELSNMTKDAHEADLSRDRAYRIGVLRKEIPKNITKDDLETQLYKIFATSILYMPMTKMNAQLAFGLTDNELRSA